MLSMSWDSMTTFFVCIEIALFFWRDDGPSLDDGASDPLEEPLLFRDSLDCDNLLDNEQFDS